MTDQGERMEHGISFDFETYAHHLAGLDLTEEEARTLLVTLFHVMVQIADLGLGIHPIQQGLAEKTCGQLPETAPDRAVTPSSMLLSKDMLTLLEDMTRDAKEGDRHDD